MEYCYGYCITGIKESKTAIWKRLKEDFEQI